MNLPDDAIVAGILSNDLNEVIFYIYKHYAELISFNVVTMGGSLQDGEDIFQETVVTFIDLVRKNKFRGDSSIKTFLVSVARNIWLNELKRKKSGDERAKIFETSRGHIENDVLENLNQREMKEQLLSLMDHLGESCRTILTFFYYENLPFEEIIHKMGYETVQVARNKKYKCMRELSDLIRNNPVLLKRIEK
ncbi:MAG TPA: sigma-70 family RNA polymerase sigma factor [bacterium]|jgi:RNA polymerase sigma factor (sigma-70 family)|nr:sigma-70 family RNA polymerase sigma factor [bacterium]